MAITARTNGTGANNAASGTSITLTKPSGVTDGDFLFVVIHANNSGGNLANLTDNNSGAFTVLDDRAEAGVFRTWVLGRVASSEPSSWSFTLSLSVPWAIVVATYVGVDTTTPEDATSTYNYNVNPSSVSDCDTLTTVTDGAWNIVVGTIDVASATITSGPGGSYTQRVVNDTNRDIAVYDLEIPTAGATGNQQISWSGTDDTQGFQFALRPAGGGGTTPVSAERTLLYDVLERVSVERILLYDITSRVSAEATLLYDVLERVSAEATLLYDLAGVVSAEATLLYDVLERVSAEATLLYDVLERVSAERTLIYDVVGRTSQEWAGRYDIISTVAHPPQRHRVQHGVKTGDILRDVDRSE